jgi:hypothetical protein
MQNVQLSVLSEDGQSILSGFSTVKEARIKARRIFFPQQSTATVELKLNGVCKQVYGSLQRRREHYGYSVEPRPLGGTNA